MLRKIILFFKNKYIFTSLVFLVWMISLDKNNMIAQYKLKHELADLRYKKAYYINEIEKDRKATYELNTNMKTLEKFAREKYLFKRNNEDIFLIVRK